MEQARRKPGRPRRLNHETLLTRWKDATAANGGVSPSKTAFARELGINRQYLHRLLRRLLPSAIRKPETVAETQVAIWRWS
jgi:hypothetical protein